MRKKIYILGETRGAYRTQNFMKYLLDNHKKYSVYYDTIFYNNVILRYLKSLFINWINILRSDIVYIPALNVGSNIMFESILAWLFKKKIILEYYVSVYDTVICDRKLFKDGGIIAKLAKSYDRIIIFLSTKVIFLNQGERVRYCKLIGISHQNKKFINIPLCIEEKECLHNNFINGNSDTFNICWWGSYLPLHGVDNILEAVKEVKKFNIPVRVYLFGDTDKGSIKYKQLCEEFDIEDVVFFNNEYTFTNGRLIDFLRENCDLALGAFGTSDKAQNVITNKLIEACAMKTLVMNCKAKPLQEFFHKDKDIFICDNNSESMAQKIVDIYNMDKKVLRDRTIRTYNIYIDKFSPKQYYKSIGILMSQVEERT